MNNSSNTSPSDSTAGNPYSKKLYPEMLSNNFIDPKTGRKDKYDRNYVKRKINHDLIKPLFPVVGYEVIETLIIELCVNHLDERERELMKSLSEIHEICANDPDMLEYFQNQLESKRKELLLKDSATKERNE